MIKKVWNSWMQFGLMLGNFISTVFLTVFYYTIFPIFAIPYRLFGASIHAELGETNYSVPDKQMEDLESFRKEF